MPISAGIPAPDFAALDENGSPRRLKDFHGKAVILYFYPAMIHRGVQKKPAIFVTIILTIKGLV